MLRWGRGRGGGLPFNIAFCLEGEEESGSDGFKEAISSNLHWFEGTSLIVIANTNWVGENIPCITYGMRGMLCASLCVSGPSKDVHRRVAVASNTSSHASDLFLLPSPFSPGLLTLPCCHVTHLLTAAETSLSLSLAVVMTAAPSTSR